MGRSPQEIEDQVTYPLSLKLQGLAGVKAVRSSSEFNFSMITIIFEDNVDFYFARQRVLEKLTLASTFLPAGRHARTWPRTPRRSARSSGTRSKAATSTPAGCWALQKFYCRPRAQLRARRGRSRHRSAACRSSTRSTSTPTPCAPTAITLGELYDAVGRSNSAVGGRVIQKNNAEYLVRSVGWIENAKDIEDTVINEVGGTPIYVKNVATVQLGPQFRRSVFEKDGNEVVGGVVLMRHGENPLAVTERIKQKIQELQPGLPAGVHIVPAYDRTRLIHGAIDTLTEVMGHEMLIARHRDPADPDALPQRLRHLHHAAAVGAVLLPDDVAAAGPAILDVQANIMSLAGITISIGILVDQAIVMVENATHQLKEHFGDKQGDAATRARSSSAPAGPSAGRSSSRC